MHSIKSDRLEAGVLFAIQQQVHLAITYSELVARINSAPLKKSKSKRLEDTIAAKEKELAKIMRYRQALYQDWKDGEITLILSRLVDTFFSRISLTMPPSPKSHNTVCV